MGMAALLMLIDYPAGDFESFGVFCPDLGAPGFGPAPDEIFGSVLFLAL
jgi:hypothetical protein